MVLFPVSKAETIIRTYRFVTSLKMSLFLGFLLVNTSSRQLNIYKFAEISHICIHWIASGGYYGLRTSTPPPQCVEIFSLPL